MLDVSLFSALLGGVLTFLAPCTLPLVPAYIGFLAGTALVANTQDERTLMKRRILSNALLFVLGFTIVFMFYGLVSGVIGKYFLLHRAVISQAGGVIIIIFGLSMLEFTPITRFLGKLFQGRKFPSFLHPGKPFSAFLLGLLFALGWSPCLGPILGTIFTLAASTSPTPMHGAMLLFVYSVGLAMPFLLIAYAYGSALTVVRSLSAYLPIITKFAGAFFMLIGVSLLLGQFGALNDIFLGSFGTWYARLVNYM